MVRNVDAAWLTRWIEGVLDGERITSVRLRASVEQHGGLGAAIPMAQLMKVHLSELVDDAGRVLVIASRHPVVLLC